MRLAGCVLILLHLAVLVLGISARHHHHDNFLQLSSETRNRFLSGDGGKDAAVACYKELFAIEAGKSQQLDTKVCRNLLRQLREHLAGSGVPTLKFETHFRSSKASRVLAIAFKVANNANADTVTTGNVAQMSYMAASGSRNGDVETAQQLCPAFHRNHADQWPANHRPTWVVPEDAKVRHCAEFKIINSDDIKGLGGGNRLLMYSELQPCSTHCAKEIKAFRESGKSATVGYSYTLGQDSERVLAVENLEDEVNAAQAKVDSAQAAVTTKADTVASVQAEVDDLKTALDDALTKAQEAENALNEAVENSKPYEELETAYLEADTALTTAKAPHGKRKKDLDKLVAEQTTLTTALDERKAELTQAKTAAEQYGLDDDA